MTATATLMEYGAQRAADWTYDEAVDARAVRRELLERFGHAAVTNIAARWLEEAHQSHTHAEQSERTFSIGLAGGMVNTLLFLLGWPLTPQTAARLERVLTITYIGESRVAAFQDPSPTTEES